MLLSAGRLCLCLERKGPLLEWQWSSWWHRRLERHWPRNVINVQVGTAQMACMSTVGALHDTEFLGCVGRWGSLRWYWGRRDDVDFDTLRLRWLVRGRYTVLDICWGLPPFDAEVGELVCSWSTFAVLAVLFLPLSSEVVYKGLERG